MDWNSIFLLGMAFIAGFAIVNYLINRAAKKDANNRQKAPWEEGP